MPTVMSATTVAVNMPVHRSTLDPYTQTRGLYECLRCGARARSDRRVEECVDCGAAVRNIAVARE